MLDATQCGIVSYGTVLGMSSFVVNVDTTGNAMATVGLPGVSTELNRAYWYLFFRGGWGICLATVIPQLQKYCK